LLVTTPLCAQLVGKQAAAADSVVHREEYVKSNEFYDGLKERSKKSGFTKFIINSIVVNSDWTGESAREATEKLTDETQYFSTYEQKEIAQIHILPRGVYADTATYFTAKLANAIHVKTREHIIRQNLLFKEGDKLQASTMILNEEMLRKLNYIADAYIIVAPHDYEDNKVDVFVHTRDQWSINADFAQKSGDEYRVLVFDENILGMGHRLTLGSYLRTASPVMPGYVLGYDVNNFSGSFFDFNFRIDRSYEESLYYAQVQKALIKPTDYAAGASYRLNEISEGQLLIDTSLALKQQIVEAWGGVSVKLKNVKSSLYFMSRLSSTQTFHYGDDVTETLNPYYRSPVTLLFSAGIYHESFYRGSYIYNFGVSEDIPYGFNLELTGGRSWDEYANRTYLAAKWSAGHLMGAGYLQESVAYGSFFCDDFTPQQSALLVNVEYFTKLFRTGKGYMRHFIKTSYTAGFHRLSGERERLTFNGDNSMRILHLPYIGGLNRLLLHLETVYFSPLYFYNFRFAFYGFSDFGWLGDRYRVFSNDLYTTLGFGVRILNDRLIFASIQLQFGYAVINPGHGDNRWIDLGSVQQMRFMRFMPNRPTMVAF
jgi:hypothetical protein